MLLSPVRLGLGPILRHFPSAFQTIEPTVSQVCMSDGFLQTSENRRCLACAPDNTEEVNGDPNGDEPNVESKVKSKRTVSPEAVNDHRKLLQSLGLSLDVLDKLEGSIVLISVGHNKGETEADRWSRRIRGASGGRGLIPRTRWLARGKRKARSR